METLITIGKILGFLAVWIIAIYIRGKIRSDVWGYGNNRPNYRRKRRD